MDKRKEGDLRQSAFHELVSKHGGALNIGEIEHSEKHPVNLLKLCSQLYETKKKDLIEGLGNQELANVMRGTDKIYFDFIKNHDINALAVIDEKNKEYIGINIGLPLRLCRYFEILLSTKEFLAEVGNGHLEKFTMNEAYPHLIGTYAGPVSYQINPISETRKAIANFLFVNSILFVFYHEIAHHLLGHLVYLKTAYGLDEYVELNFSPYENRPEFYEARRAMELQADELAARLAYVDVITAQTESESLLKGENVTTTDLLLWSVFLVFNIFQDQYKYVAENKQTQHPHPSVRRLNLIEALARIEVSRGGNKEAVYRRFQNAIFEYELMVHLINKEPANHKSTYTLPLEELNKYWEIVLNSPLTSQLHECRLRRNSYGLK